MIIGMGIIAVPAGLVASALTKAKEMEGWVTFLFFPPDECYHWCDPGIKWSALASGKRPLDAAEKPVDNRNHFPELAPTFLISDWRVQITDIWNIDSIIVLSLNKLTGAILWQWNNVLSDLQETSNETIENEIVVTIGFNLV